MIKRVLYRVENLDRDIPSGEVTDLGMRVAVRDPSLANVISSEVFGKPGIHAPAFDLDNHGYDDRMSWSYNSYCEWRNAAIINIVASYLDIERDLIYLAPSKSKGHAHLYIEQEMDWPLYASILTHLVVLKFVELNYLMASGSRSATFLRLPPKEGWFGDTSSPAYVQLYILNQAE